MDKKLQISKSFKSIMLIMIVIGVVAVATGFFTGETDRTWANLLLNNFMFLSIALGGLFWMAMQAISQSGWSSAFLRIPQAFTVNLLLALVMWIPLFFGMPHLFHWLGADAAHDVVIAHKTPYLNVPFFTIRTIVFFILWFIIACRIRKLSVKEDTVGGLDSFNKIEFLSKVFIFVLGVTFFFFALDWLMTIEVHWFSTLFSIKMFVSAFYHGSAIVAGIAIILYKLGYFPFMNKAHFHDFSKYIFMLSIMWGYMWFMQYLLIWYGNLPEETAYYNLRREGGFQGFFLAEIFINWAFPFLFIMWNRIAKNPNALLFTIAVLIVGQFIELYIAVMPGIVHHAVFGFIEVGTFIGFAGAFALVTAKSLSKFPLVAKNHPYLDESFALEDYEEEY